MYALAGAQCSINIMYLASYLEREIPGPLPYPAKYSLSLILIIIATTLVIVARYVSEKRFNFTVPPCDLSSEGTSGEEGSAEIRTANIFLPVKLNLSAVTANTW